MTAAGRSRHSRKIPPPACLAERQTRRVQNPVPVMGVRVQIPGWAQWPLQRGPSGWIRRMQGTLTGGPAGFLPCKTIVLPPGDGPLNSAAVPAPSQRRQTAVTPGVSARLAKWQTRRLEGPVSERTSGFKSRDGHALQHHMEIPAEGWRRRRSRKPVAVKRVGVRSSRSPRSQLESKRVASRPTANRPRRGNPSSGFKSRALRGVRHREAIPQVPHA